MTKAVCTIITSNYGHYALALHDSLLGNKEDDFTFCVFVSNGELPKDISNTFKTRKNVLILSQDDFKDNDLVIKLRNKYANSYHDAFRWSMKPLLLVKLLKLNFNKVIYVDSDVFFFSKYQFLFNQLETCKLLLSPHWRSSSPIKDVENFELNFMDGIYNGGFVGASEGAEEILRYWAGLCYHNVEVNRAQGYYVDQRYLDILPTRFEGVDHIKHKGCNVANWNQVDCRRVVQNDGSVLINDKYPIIFIHFTNSFFKGVYLWKSDSVLQSYVEKYRDTLLKYSPIDVIELFFKRGVNMPQRKDKQVSLLKKNKPIANQLLYWGKKIVKRVKNIAN